MERDAAIARPETIARQVHRRLRARILSGEIGPSDRLVGVEVARALDVSRTPVREAFLLLEADGLVTPERAGGVAVRNLRAELEDILAVRAALETYAVRVAARSSSRTLADTLATLCAEAERLALGEVEARARLNRAFHETLVEAAGSRRLAQAAASCREYFTLATPLYDAETVRQSNREHRLILEAVRAGDAAEAERLVESHLRRALDAVRAHPGGSGRAA